MPRGGARVGAGRPGSSTKAEECRRINVGDFARAGVLVPGRQGTWRWWDSVTLETTAAITYVTAADRVTLTFRLCGAPARQVVPIEHVTSAVGLRPYFNCPSCGARASLLFLGAEGFGCRACRRIAYQCQSEDAIGRAWLRQAKVEARLGEGLKRPPGMRQATYERLMGTIEDCERERRRAVVRAIQRHLKAEGGDVSQP